MQVILLAIATFIFAIDQFSLTETIYRPMIACPIIGLILGDLQTGLVIGGTYELMMVGNMPVGGAQPPNAGLAAIMAVVLGASLEEQDPQAALGLAIPFALLGILIIVLFFISAKKNQDKEYRFMWLTIVLSFAFYIPVVLWADLVPAIGFLMMPKTCAYVWTVLIGFMSMRKCIG